MIQIYSSQPRLSIAKWRSVDSIIVFNFFADVAGFLPERLQHELTWERVANLTGKTGMNQP